MPGAQTVCAGSAVKLSGWVSFFWLECNAKKKKKRMQCQSAFSMNILEQPLHTVLKLILFNLPLNITDEAREEFPYFDSDNVSFFKSYSINIYRMPLI